MINKKTRKNDFIQIEEILKKRGLLTKESIFKNVVENKTVKQLGKIILAAAFISGAIVIAVAAPNIIGALGRLHQSFKKNKHRQSNNQKIALKTLQNLQNNKLIEKTIQGDKIMFTITPQGRAVFLKRHIYELKVNKLGTWDKIWRVVLFDIPNAAGKQRDLLRDRLKKMGFYQFQKSAFIIPYPCRRELEAILEYYNLFDYVTYLETSCISGEQKCRQYFDI